MTDPNDDFDFPKLGDALRPAYTHRATIPPSLDDAIHLAARERFAQRRRLRLIARWGTGLVAGIAAAIVVLVSLHRSPPVAPLRFVHQMTMIDTFNVAQPLDS